MREEQVRDVRQVIVILLMAFPALLNLGFPFVVLKGKLNFECGSLYILLMCHKKCLLPAENKCGPLKYEEE